MKTQVHGGVTGGKFLADNSYEFLSAFRVHEGKKVTVSVEEFINKRSIRQNDYIWGSVYEEALDGFRDLGWEIDKDGVHSHFAKMFLTVPVFNKDGERVTDKILSTAKLNKVQFTLYIEQIAKYCAEHLSVVISPPNSDLRS